MVPSQLPRVRINALHLECRSSNESPFLYVMDDAVERLAPAAQGAAPVPPCVLAQKDGAGVIVDVDDKADSVGIITLRPDKLRVQLMSSVANARCNEELTSFLAKALDVRQERLAVRSLAPPGWMCCFNWSTDCVDAVPLYGCADAVSSC